MLNVLRLNCLKKIEQLKSQFRGRAVGRQLQVYLVLTKDLTFTQANVPLGLNYRLFARHG
jgi:hypothetical protein